MERDADALLLRELLHLADEQFDEVIRQLMLELEVEPRKIRNKPTYYFAEVVSMKDQNRETLFVNKGTGVIGTVDVEKLAMYSEKVRAPRSLLITLGEVSREAEKEGRRKNVKLISGKDLAALIRKSSLEDMILKEFAHEDAVAPPPSDIGAAQDSAAMGMESLQSGNPTQALEHLERAIAVDPESDAVWRLKGNALDMLGQHERALECYARAMEINPKSAELWYMIGASMYHLGRYDDELSAYDKALQLDPRLEGAMLNKGSTLLKLHRYQDALEAFNRLLKLNPRIVRAHSDKGIALVHLKKLDDALNAFESALALNPEFSEAWLNRGSILIQLGRFEEALACFDNLSVLRPYSAKAWRAKGQLEGGLGRSHDAIASFEKVLEIEPTDIETKKMLDAAKARMHAERADLHGKIAELFFAAGMEVQPEPTLEEPAPQAPSTKKVVIEAKAAESEPADEGQEPPEVGEMIQQTVIPDDLLSLEQESYTESPMDVAEEVFGDSADLMLLMKRPELALDEAEKGLRLEPMSVRMLLSKGSSLFATGQREEALKAFSRAAELEPGRKEAVLSIEYLLSSLGKYSEAEEAIEPLLDGKEWMPEILAAMDSFQAGKIKEVREHMEAAISLSPSAMVWNYRGLLELDQGDFERAIETFGHAREMEQVFSDPSNNTGVAHAKLGSQDDASNWYDIAISAQPRNHVAWSNRGVLLSQLKRYKEALACFDQSLLLQNDPLVVINKGFTQLKMDTLEEALASFETSISIKETAEGFNNKGIVLVRMKRMNDAIRSFRKSLELAPDFQDAKKNLELYAKQETPEPKRAAKAPEHVSVPPKDADAAWRLLEPYDDATLNKMRRSELDEMCDALGLSNEGSKKEVVERISIARRKHMP